MASLSEMKASSPAYQALTDQEFADKVYQKFYAGTISRDEFDKRTAPKPVDLAGEITAPFAGFNKGVDALINLPGAALNLVGADKAINYGAEKLGYEPPLPNGFGVSVATQANTGYEPQTIPGKIGETIGEVAGGAIVPEVGILARGLNVASKGPAAVQAALPITQRAAQAGVAGTAKAAALPTAGAGLGVYGAREADLGPVGEIAGGLIGGFAVPNAANFAARGYSAAKGAKAYTGRQMARARDPQLAADQDTTNALLKAGVEPKELLQEFAPSPSGQLKSRGVTADALADAVARVKAGESPDTIAQSLKINPDTLLNYVRYLDANPTPRNVADVVQDRTNVGQASPVLRLGRSAFGIADEGEVLGKLTARQNDQYGRLGNIFRKAARNRDYDQTMGQLDETLGEKSNQAYGLAHQNEQTFDLQPTLRSMRERANGSAGEIRDTLNKAIDLFFEPVTQPKRISAMEDVRMQEMAERIAKAEAAENPNPERIAQLKRRYDAMRDDAEFNANAKPEVIKTGKPIGDVKRFQAAREALDQMISQSKNAQGRATPLTRHLTALRRSVNTIMRDANPLMAAADDQFSGAKSAQDLIKRGEQLTTQLGSKQDEFFKDFAKLNAEQRELIRLSFLKTLENKSARPQDGAALANQFRSPEVRKTIKRLFGPELERKGMKAAEIKALRARNKENRTLGDDLIKAGLGEATSTHTLNAITNRGNTQTAPWQRDMALAQEGAELVGDAVTMNWMSVLRKTGKKLANQIGERQAKIILDNLTNTAPEEVIPKIRRWVQLAKTAEERNAYVLSAKEFAKALRRPGTEIGASIAASGPELRQDNRLLQQAR